MNCKVITPKKLDSTSAKADKELEWQLIFEGIEQK